MIHTVGDPIPVLDGALECLLLRYRYDAQESSLELVLDYRKSVGVDRTFLRVRFGSVSHFRRLPGLHEELQTFTMSYLARAVRGATVVESVRIDREARPMRVALGFGHSFGGIEFTCESISAHSRNALATKRKDEEEWDYRDADNGAPLDFYDPFA